MICLFVLILCAILVITCSSFLKRVELREMINYEFENWNSIPVIKIATKQSIIKHLSHGHEGIQKQIAKPKYGTQFMPDLKLKFNQKNWKRLHRPLLLKMEKLKSVNWTLPLSFPGEVEQLFIKLYSYLSLDINYICH